MPEKIISITNGRRDLFKIAEEVQLPNTFYKLTVDGNPKIVMMSHDEFQSIMETLEILSNPEIMDDLREAEEDFKKGNYVSLEEVKKNLGIRTPELILRDKSKKRYQAEKKKNGKSK